MGVAFLAFMPDGMSFEEYFRFENKSELRQYINFLLGLTPNGMHRAYLVDPTHETKLAAPTDGFIPATDPEQDELGKMNTSYSNDPHGLKSAADGKAGFIVE